MNKKCLFLGTGGSMGTPIIGCKCNVCTSNSHFNKRLRPSLFLSIENKNIIIDVGPDFRQQALLYNLEKIDGIIQTHCHYDHFIGLDELSTYYFKDKKPFDILLSKQTYECFKRVFHYLLENDRTKNMFNFNIINDDIGKIKFLNFPIEYFSYFQKKIKVMGFRIFDFAYITDIHDYDEKIFSTVLKGINTLVVSCLKEKSQTHFGIKEAIEFANKTLAKKIWLTHLPHEVDHEEVKSKLPNNFNLAYDGLIIDI